MRPGPLLAVLLVLATIAGFFLRGQFLRATAKPAVAPLTTAAQPAPTPPQTTPPPSADPWQALARSIAATRELTFRDPPKFQRATREEIGAVWKESTRQQYPGDNFERMGLAYQFLGFLEPEVELDKMLLSAASPSTECVYDSTKNLLLHVEGDLADPWRRELFAQQVTLHLLDQSFGLDEATMLPEVQADESAARRGFVLGDAGYHAARFARGTAAAMTPPAQVLEYFARVPQPMQDQLLLGHREGVTFCQVLRAQGLALDSVYQQLPTCTAHLLHPELYLRQPRYQPKRIKWAKLDFMGAEPRWDNVAGELMIRGLLRKVMAPAEADPIAAEWDGDRHILYIVGGGPQLAWKTLWRGEEAARRFFKAMKNAAIPIFGVEQANLLSATDEAVEYGGNLSLLLQRQSNAVHLSRTTEPEWRAIMEALMRDARVNAP